MESSRATRPEPSAVPVLAALLVFYVVQGLPFGFQAMALPVLLRRAGVEISTITAMGLLLSLPWALKIVVAPVVDSRFSPRLGRRRSWILPMQLGMAASAALAALAAPAGAMAALLAAVFVMNLCAAIMDVAVDGLAIERLAERHLGYGNAIQVAGYKLGMLAGGGAVLALSGTVGVASALAIMAGVALAGALVALAMREPDVARARDAREEDAGEGAPASAGDVLRLLRAALASRAGRVVLLFVGTYKAGEAMADALFRLFLVDAGFTDRQIGLWVSTYGMVASLLGSVAGGVLASRTRSLVAAVGVTAALRALSLGLELHAVAFPSADAVLVATIAQHFFGGALTAAMFAFMMSVVDRRIGATHYTMLATVEGFGKGLARWASGFLGEWLGYVPVYALAVVLSVVFLGLLRPASRAAADVTGPT